jgi:hypothetical protein
MSFPGKASLLDSMTGLKRHWLEVLDASEAAVEAASCAHVLPVEESRAYFRRLGTDRTWLETVDWSEVEAVPGGTISILEAPPKVPQLNVVKSAA